MFTHSEGMDESKMAVFLGIYPDIFVYSFVFAAWTIILISIYMIPKNILAGNTRANEIPS